MHWIILTRNYLSINSLILNILVNRLLRLLGLLWLLGLLGSRGYWATAAIGKSGQWGYWSYGIQGGRKKKCRPWIPPNRSKLHSEYTILHICRFCYIFREEINWLIDCMNRHFIEFHEIFRE